MSLTFFEIALPLALRGIPVIPVEPLDKPCYLPEWEKRATTETEQIHAWNAENPDYNVGCVGKPNGFVILDCDVKKLAQRIEKETGQEFPPTLIVKSAGKGCLHLYFRQTDRSRKLGNKKAKGLFDLQSVDKYVVGPGSRLSNGKTYDIMQDGEIAFIPDSLCEWVEQNADPDKKRSDCWDASPVHEDFDFEDFCEFYEISGHQKGDWFVPSECPIAGYQHESSPLTGFYWDGEFLGWNCFVTSCASNNMSIGQVIKFLNEKKGESYQGVIWSYPEEDEFSDIAESVEYEDAVPEAPPVKPNGQAIGKHGMTPDGEAEYEARKQRIAEMQADLREAEESEEAPEPEASVPDISTVVLYQAHNETHVVSLTGHLASSVTPVPIRWIWPERFPAGKLALLNGPQGSGKSMLFIDIIAHTTMGKDWPDGAKNTLGPRKVLLASTEDDEKDTIIPRLMAAEADLSMVTILDKVRIEEIMKGEGIKGTKSKAVLLNLKAHIKLIMGLLQKYPDVALILLDPITAFLGVDETKDKDTRPVLESLAEAMQGTLATLIGIIHSNKMTKGSAGDKVKGGSSMLGVVRTAWAVGRDPDDKNQRYMALIKGNVLKKETGLKFTVENKVLDVTTGLEAGHVLWGDEMDEDANEMLAASRETRDGTNIDKKREIFKALVQTALADGPKRSREDIYPLGKQKNICERTMKSAISDLGVHHNKRGAWFMSLPPNCGSSCRACGTSQSEDPQMPDHEGM